MTPGAPVTVSVTVKNTGDQAGKDVIHIYISDTAFSLPNLPKEFKGFTNVTLEPSETRTVSFTLDERALSFNIPEKKGWVAEPGESEVLVSGLWRDSRGKAVFMLV